MKSFARFLATDHSNADFVVLDRDILSIPPEEIDQVQVEATYADGACVYRSER